MSKEYNGTSISQSSCTYKRMQDVYPPSDAKIIVSQGTYTVPQICPNSSGLSYPPRPDTLTHGQSSSCGGYFNVKNAYPYASCDHCDETFVEKPCVGNITCTKEGYRRRRR